MLFKFRYISFLESSFVCEVILFVLISAQEGLETTVLLGKRQLQENECLPFYSFLPILSFLYEASEGAKLSLQKLIDISISLESAVKHVAQIQIEFKHPNEAISKIEQKSPSLNYSAKRFRFNNLYDPKLFPFKDKKCLLKQN